MSAGEWSEFLRAVKNTPRAAGCVIKASIREGFRATTAQSIGLLQNMYMMFAVIVAFGTGLPEASMTLPVRRASPRAKAFEVSAAMRTRASANDLRM